MESFIRQASDEEVANSLEEAAQIIERDGWVRGKYGCPEVGWCAVGAIERVNSYGLSQTRHSRSQAATDAELLLAAHLLAEDPAAELSEMESLVSAGLHLVFRWNDTEGRTVEDVTNALRKTALTLREQA